MDRQNPTPPPKPPAFKNGVTAALEICDARRAMATGVAPNPENAGGMRLAVQRTAVIVDAAAARLDAKDFTALEAVCASHVLALDVIFNEFARDAARVEDYLSRSSMATALRAQSQCRMMVNTLCGLHGRALSAAAPGAKPEEKNKNSADRIIETENPPT